MVPHDRGCPPTDTTVVVRTEHRESEPLLQTILRALARRNDVPVTALPPLYDWIDLEALEALRDHATAHDTPVTVEFVFEGDRVVVSHDGQVRILETQSVDRRDHSG